MVVVEETSVLLDGCFEVVDRSALKKTMAREANQPYLVR
jgi:hypothetical protein